MFYGCAFRKLALKLEFEQGRHLKEKKKASLASAEVLISLKAQRVLNRLSC